MSKKEAVQILIYCDFYFSRPLKERLEVVKYLQERWAERN